MPASLILGEKEMSKNAIIIHGYLGRDPELEYKTGQNGQYAHVSFSVGVSRDFGDETDWFYCIMNGKRAEVIDKYFHKGSQILLEGRMESYKDKDNPKRTNWVLKVSDFDFCDSSGKSNNASSSNAPAPAQSEPQQASFNDLPDSFEQAEDDIPF